MLPMSRSTSVACKYHFFEPSGCHFGSECKYSHEPSDCPRDILYNDLKQVKCIGLDGKIASKSIAWCKQNGYVKVIEEHWCANEDQTLNHLDLRNNFVKGSAFDADTDEKSEKKSANDSDQKSFDTFDRNDGDDDCQESADYSSDIDVIPTDCDISFGIDEYIERLNKNKRVPKIVSLAEDGDLAAIKVYIQQKGDVNKRQKWTETEQKYFYDKSWDWFGKSALMAAVQNGDVDIVKELLLGLADPMLKSCLCCDEYDTALDLATQKRFRRDEAKMDQIISMLSVVNDLWTKLNPKCHESASWTDKRSPKNVPNRSEIEKAIKDLNL